MLSSQYISSIIPTLLPQDSAARALEVMQDNHCTQLPIVNTDNVYIGMVGEDMLLDWNDDQVALKETVYPFLQPCVHANAHVFDAIALMQNQNITLVPVVADNNVYIGTISLATAFKHLAEGTMLSTNGATIIMQTAEHNYSLSRIAGIFESENVNAVSILTHIAESEIEKTINITIKTNKQDLRAVTSSLERFHYSVIHIFSEINDKEDLESNYNSLLNYLNM